MQQRNVKHRRLLHRARVAFSVAVTLALLGGGAYGVFLVGRWFLTQDEINPTVVAALAVGSLTALTSVYIASYNARRARERAAQEANRGTKADLYNGFIDLLAQAMRKAKDGSELETEDIQERLIGFTSKLMVYGGPSVIKAFSAWRSMASSDVGQTTNGDTTTAQFVLVEQLLRAMRNDLGESNKGIETNELLGLIIVGGKAEIDKALNKT